MGAVCRIICIGGQEFTSPPCLRGHIQKILRGSCVFFVATMRAQKSSQDTPPTQEEMMASEAPEQQATHDNAQAAAQEQMSIYRTLYEICWQCRVPRFADVVRISGGLCQSSG